MTKWSKDGGSIVVYIDNLGCSTVTLWVLQKLRDEGKLEDLAQARVPRAETVPAPLEDEAVVFVAFFDAGLRFPLELVARVLRLYQMELTQLMSNVKLTVFK